MGRYQRTLSHKLGEIFHQEPSISFIDPLNKTVCNQIKATIYPSNKDISIISRDIVIVLIKASMETYVG